MISLGPVPMGLVLLAIAMGVAALVGRQLVPAPVEGQAPLRVGGTLFDMLLVGLLVGRLVFVLQWLPLYRQDLWSVLRIGDGGYSIWAAVLAGLLFGLWQIRGQPALRRPLLLGTLAGMLVWASLAGALAWMQRSSIGLPDLTLEQVNGPPLALQDLSGKPVVLNLWATWCPPCRREMPVLARAQSTLPQVHFVFANQGEGAQTVRDWLGSSGLVMHNLLLDSGSAVMQASGARGLPTTLFFDAQGRLVDVHMGELTDAGLAGKLQRLGVDRPPSTAVTPTGNPLP